MTINSLNIKYIYIFIYIKHAHSSGNARMSDDGCIAFERIINQIGELKAMFWHEQENLSTVHTDDIILFDSN